MEGKLLNVIGGGKMEGNLLSVIGGGKMEGKLLGLRFLCLYFYFPLFLSEKGLWLVLSCPGFLLGLSGQASPSIPPENRSAANQLLMTCFESQAEPPLHSPAAKLHEAVEASHPHKQHVHCQLRAELTGGGC